MKPLPPEAAARTAASLAPWAVLLVVFVAWEVYRWGAFYAASDDSYIYLGYVKRVLTAPHELFSYNAGEHSAGTTGLVYYYLLIVVCGVIRLLTLPLPIEHSLLIGMVVLNAMLFLGTAALYLRIWAQLTGRAATGPTLAGLFLLFCLHPQFLWGVFAGMENPLSALLVLALVDQTMRRVPAWQVSLSAALLCGTRPELTPVVVWLPVLAAWRQPHRARPLWAAILVAVTLWALAFAAIVAPCFALTGRVFPSALGARVTVSALADPSQWETIARAAIEAGDYWSTTWVIAAVACLVATTVLRGRAGWLMPAIFAVVLANFVLRAVLGLTHLNLEARYVSYVWPLYALGIAWSVRQLHGLVGAPDVGSRITTIVALAAAIPSLLVFRARFDRHVGAMDQLVVAPARWMQRNLPPGSRIAMEPAGALRVFTDHYLVDSVGLTTTHFATFRGLFPPFWVEHRVDFVFDYAGRVQDLGRGVLGEPLRAWADPASLGLPMTSWGVLGTYRMALEPVHITALATSRSEPGNSVPEAAFDNWLGSPPELVPYWYAGEQVPAWIEARFAAPIAIDAIEITSWGRDHPVPPAGRHTPGSFTFHGWDGSAWVPLPIAAQRSSVPVATLETIAVDLRTVTEVRGIRFQCDRTVGVTHLAPVVLEISLLADGRRHVWFD